MFQRVMLKFCCWNAYLCAAVLKWNLMQTEDTNNTTEAPFCFPRLKIFPHSY